MAQYKFGRNYALNVQTGGGSGSIIDLGSTLVVKPPFTLTFDISRNVFTSTNTASIRVYNLSANHRAQIRKNVTDLGDYRAIQLLAGYGDNLSIAFDGTITNAWSVREGTNFITQIESFDGGFAFANAVSNTPFPIKTTQKEVIASLIGDLSIYGVKPGVIGTFNGPDLVRQNSYEGSTTNLLQQLTGGRFYIDNGKAYALADNECLTGPITTISPASGLLGTPTREQTIVNLEMLFEPKLVVGQQVTLASLTADRGINGDYKVISLSHRGMISEAVCGDAVTQVGLYQPLGSQGLQIVGAV